MSLREWSKSEVEYGVKLFNSGVEGARCGREEFLHGEPLEPYVENSVRQAWVPAAMGACLGMMAGAPHDHDRRPIMRMLGFALLGGAIGFTAGIAWETRRLTASVASGVVNNVSKVRDEHWFQKHPIDYA
jgi:hypothetical protein